MSAEDDIQQRSRAALRAFREKVEALGLWNGAWVSLMAIRSPSSGWVGFVLRSILTAPAVTVPSQDALFDATTDNVRIRVWRLSLVDLWALLAELAEGTTTRLSSLFGEPLALPKAKNPSDLQFSRSHSRRERQHLLLYRNVSVPFHELFGFELFERLGPELKTHHPPYSGTREVSDNMLTIWGSSFDQNNSSPVFEVSAELPIDPVKAFYNPAFRGIEIRTRAGLSVPLERLAISITPSPRCRLLGIEFEGEVSGDAVALLRVMPSDEPTSEIAVDLLFDDVLINTDRIRPSVGAMPLIIGGGEGKAGEAWVGVLERDFHWSPLNLRRRLRAALPHSVATIAEARIADAIRMREEFPFFALVSAASVSEVLLMEGLASVSEDERRKAWGQIRARDNTVAAKLPNDLRFDQAIRLASELGLLRDIDSQSIDLLRVARNEVHLDRSSQPSHEDFSPVRASAAILATLNLCAVKRLARQRAPKSAAPSGSPSNGGAPPPSTANP